jgi:hypothetical protein
MIRITLVAAAVLTIAPVFGGPVPAKADNGPALRMAQGYGDYDRDRHDRDRSERRDRDFTVGVGPGGVHVGPRAHCRTVTTWIDRDDGRRVKRTERRCD